MTLERWHHICEVHPVMRNSLENIQEALVSPSYIQKHRFDPHVRIYVKYVKQHTPRFLLVIVKYLNGIGYIITSYFDNQP